MRLALRFTLALVLGIVVVLAIYDGWVALDQARELETRIGDDLGLVARGLSVAVPDLVRAAGEPAAERLIAERNREGIATVRWVRLDAPAGDRRYVALSSEERDELARAGSLRVVRNGNGADAHLFVYRNFTGDDLSGTIEVSQSLAPVRERASAALRMVFARSIAIVALSSLYALALGVRLVGRPIEALVAQARRIGAGDLSSRLSPTGHDEMAQLATEMNLMCDHIAEARDELASESQARVAAIEQLRHADRLKTVGQLASGVAHELGTPLNVVAAHAKIIASGDATPSETVDSARVIAEQAGRMTAIIRQLLDFARRRPPRLDVGDLGAIARRTLAMFSHLAQRSRVELHASDGASLAVRMDEGQIQQAVTNLVVNGIQAMPKGGALTVELARALVTPPPETSLPRGAYACLTVADEGVGIQAGDLARVFEPFFTTKDVGEGTGLGLSVSYGIVSDHGGWIAVESEPGHGSRFRLYLPLADEETTS